MHAIIVLQLHSKRYVSYILNPDHILLTQQDDFKECRGLGLESSIAKESFPFGSYLVLGFQRCG